MAHELPGGFGRTKARLPRLQLSDRNSGAVLRIIWTEQFSKFRGHAGDGEAGLRGHWWPFHFLDGHLCHSDGPLRPRHVRLELLPYGRVPPEGQGLHWSAARWCYCVCPDPLEVLFQRPESQLRLLESRLGPPQEHGREAAVPAQGQGAAHGGPQQGVPQGQGGAQFPNGGVLGQVNIHLQAGPNPGAAAVGPAVPNPPNHQPANLILRQQNLPPLPVVPNQVQHWQNQGLVPQGNQVVPPPRRVRGRAPLPPAHPQPGAQALLAQAGNLDSSLSDYDEQFSFFSPDPFKETFYHIAFDCDSSASDEEI